MGEQRSTGGGHLARSSPTPCSILLMVMLSYRGVRLDVTSWGFVREKEHCGLRVAVLMLGFMPKATVAKRTSQRACRLGLHTVAPPPSQPLRFGAQGVAPGGNGARLAQCDFRAQLRVAIRVGLGRPRLHNGDETAGCGPDDAIQGGADDLANVSKRG